MATLVPHIVISEDTVFLDRQRSSISSSFSSSGDPITKRLLDGLRHHDLFTSIPTSYLIRIVRSFSFIHLRRGDVITKWGEEGDAMYWVGAGRVKIVDEEQEARLAEIGRGMFFGECAVSLEGIKRKATMTVISEHALLGSLTKEELRDALSEMPELLESLQKHTRSLYETALIGRHEFGRKGVCKLSELKRLFPDMNALTLQKWIELGWVEKRVYQGNALVHVRHAKHVLVVVVSGEVGVFKRERTEPVVKLLPEHQWKLEDTDYLRALSECKVLIFDLAHCHFGGKIEKPKQQDVLPGLESILHALSDNDCLATQLINYPKTRPLELGEETRPVFFDDGSLERFGRPSFEWAMPEPNRTLVKRRHSTELAERLGSPLAGQVSVGIADLNEGEQVLAELLGDRFDLVKQMMFYEEGILDCTAIATEITDELLVDILRTIDKKVIKRVRLDGCSRLTSVDAISIEELVLSDCWSLKTLSNVRDLRRLTLANNHSLDQIDLRDLINLTELSISHCCNITDDTIHNLLTNNHETLRVLKLHRLGITNKAFTLKPVMGMLKELECSECSFVTNPDNLLQNIPKLEHLNISMSGFRDVELKSDTITTLNVQYLEDLDFDKLALPRLQRITIHVSQWHALGGFQSLKYITANSMTDDKGDEVSMGLKRMALLRGWKLSPT